MRRSHLFAPRCELRNSTSHVGFSSSQRGVFVSVRPSRCGAFPSLSHARTHFPPYVLFSSIIFHSFPPIFLIFREKCHIFASTLPPHCLHIASTLLPFYSPKTVEAMWRQCGILRASFCLKDRALARFVEGVEAKNNAIRERARAREERQNSASPPPCTSCCELGKSLLLFSWQLGCLPRGK